MGIADLFKAAHKSNNPEVRLKAAARTTDEQILFELAANDPSPRVRMTAVSRLNDQSLLMTLALDGKQIDSRIAAVERIESQQRLAEIIRLRRNYELMAACFTRITDKKILEAIANDTSYNRSARRIAIENFADEAYLEDSLEQPSTGDAAKTPEEIDQLIARYGGVQLVRSLGKFRGSKSAMLALGEIMRRGGEPSLPAVEYLAQALIHANEEVRQAAEDQLATMKSSELIAHLMQLTDKAILHERVLAVLRRIDHPDARQITGQ